MFNSERVGKKKRLTDPVSILPFPNQTSKQENTTSPSQKSQVVTPSSSFTRPEAKILSVPTGQLNTSNLSIKQILTPSNNASSTLEMNASGDLPYDNFSFDQAKMVWKK